MCAQKPKEWAKWLVVVEWWYNTTFHSALQLTSYEVVYNQPPPLHLLYLPRESLNPVVDRSMQRREEMIRLLNLGRSQHRMKQMGYKGRSDRVFQVGYWV